MIFLMKESPVSIRLRRNIQKYANMYFYPGRLKKLLYIASFHYAKSPHTVASVVNRLFERGGGFNFTWVCRKEDHGQAAECFLLTL